MNDWVPITSVPQQIAEMLQELLWKEGIVSRVETATAGSFLGVSPYPCQVLVRPDQAEHATTYLREVTGHEFDPDGPGSGNG